MNLRPRDILLAYNDCISRKDLDGLSDLMSEDHCFVDTALNVMSGKIASLNSWRGFFSAFLDYHNEFEQIIERDTDVVAVGHSVCSDCRLAGPAIWQAKIKEDLVSEWRVFDASDDARKELGLDVI